MKLPGPQLSIACICDAPVVNDDATMTYPRARHWVAPDEPGEDPTAYLAVAFVGAPQMPPQDLAWMLHAPDGAIIDRAAFPIPVNFATSVSWSGGQPFPCTGLSEGVYLFEVSLGGQLVARVPFGVRRRGARESGSSRAAGSPGTSSPPQPDGKPRKRF